METARLNESELLRLGFSRPTVAALRNIQRVTGTGTESATVADIDTNLSGVESDIAEINGDVDSLQSGLATANTNIANLRGDLTTAESAINALESDKEDVTNKVTSLSAASTDIEYPSAKVVYDELQDKQDVLVSGVNIRTVNGNTLLGSTDLVITGGGSYSQILSAVSLRV